MPYASRKLVEWDEEYLTLKQVSKKVKRSADCLRVWFNSHGCNTKEKIIARMEHLRKCGRQEAHIHNTTKGKLTVQQMYDIHPFKDRVSKSLLSGRISRGLVGSEAMWLPKLSRAEYTIAMKEIGEYVVPNNATHGEAGNADWQKLGSRARHCEFFKIGTWEQQNPA